MSNLFFCLEEEFIIRGQQAAARQQQNCELDAAGESTVEGWCGWWGLLLSEKKRGLQRGVSRVLRSVILDLRAVDAQISEVAELSEIRRFALRLGSTEVEDRKRQELREPHHVAFDQGTTKVKFHQLGETRKPRDVALDLGVIEIKHRQVDEP